MPLSLPQPSTKKPLQQEGLAFCGQCGSGNIKTFPADGKLYGTCQDCGSSTQIPSRRSAVIETRAVSTPDGVVIIEQTSGYTDVILR